VPFAFVFAWIFSTIIYFWVEMGYGVYNYAFFCGVVTFVAFVGLFTCLFFVALLKKEFAARNMYFVTIFFLLMLSGFPFQLGVLHGGTGSVIQNYMNDISKINPLRWAFEALMKWKFTRGYIDPYLYLDTFSFSGYDHNHIFNTLGHFIIFSGACFILLLCPGPMLMSRRVAGGKRTRFDSTASRDSESGSFDASNDKTVAGRESQSMSRRSSETIKPVIYSRESSLLGKSRLSTTVSQTGIDNDTTGPTVTFKEITYRVHDPKSPLKYKTVLNNVSGQFVKGNLSLIIGSNSSGKTSLLHTLAGDVGPMSDFTGDVYYGIKPINKSRPLWQRCALVDAHDELYRDLTVEQAIVFAMKLRCWNFSGFSVIEENVRSTINLLHLNGILKKKVKHCTLGERRRVSIAEELVAGPKLLLIDEPTTELDIYEEAILMTTLREVVNQDRTVIAACQQPTANVFKLFDVVLLLMNGRVIYQGSITNAYKFFVESPYKYNFTRYQSNPSDFLIAISSGAIKDHQGNINEDSNLSEYYRSTELFGKSIKRIETVISNGKEKLDAKISSIDSKSTSSSANPLQYGAKDKHLNNVNRTDTDTSLELEAKESFHHTSEKPIASQVTVFCKFLLLVFFNNCSHCGWDDFKLSFFKMYIILNREIVNLLQRWELCLGALVVHVGLAAIFGWIVGDTGCTLCIYNATSFFAVGVLVLFLASVQFIYYQYRYNLVCLKEQSRGLYTNFSQWAVAMIPLHGLRCICAVVFSAITYKMLKFQDDYKLFQYFLVANMIGVLAMSMLTEAIIAYVPSQRAAYFMVPGLTFFQFTFSGLFIKAQSLPNWLAPWITSLSMIRWVFQGNWINQFKNDDRLISIPEIDFDSYTAFLRLFGWGGKSKWFCVYMLFIFMVVFKAASYFAGNVATLIHRCGRRYKESLPN